MLLCSIVGDSATKKIGREAVKISPHPVGFPPEIHYCYSVIRSSKCLPTCWEMFRLCLFVCVRTGKDYPVCQR